MFQVYGLKVQMEQISMLFVDHTGENCSQQGMILAKYISSHIPVHSLG